MKGGFECGVLPWFVLAVAGVLPTAVRAQIDHSATALNRMTCDAGQVFDSIRAGTSLSPSQQMSASNGFAFASGNYRTTTSRAGLSFSLSESATGHFSGAAGTGSNESLWVIQSAQPLNGVLTLSGSSVTPTLTSATAAVDIGNDGSVEWTVASGAPLQVPVTILNSLEVRVTTRTLSGFGTARFSVALQFRVTAEKDVYGSGCGAPLSLDSNVPVIGANWDLTSTNVDPASSFVVGFFGTRGPAVPLAQMGLNAPGCFSHLSSTVGTLVANQTAGSATITIPIPNDLALVGLRLASQSVCLTSANSAGLLTSNGLEGLVGH